MNITHVSVSIESESANSSYCSYHKANDQPPKFEFYGGHLHAPNLHPCQCRIG